MSPAVSFFRHKGALVGLLLLIAGVIPAFASSPEVDAAEHLLLHGHADQAIVALRGITQVHPRNGEAHLLLCRAFYSEGLINLAVPECEAALTAGLDHSSEAQDWMGRVYGAQAEQAGPITGLKLAFRVKSAFETAVQLDPHNASAVDDLGEYYVDAPAIVGGGLSKAKNLVARSTSSLPQSAHRLQAMAAVKDGDYGTAEREFRAAATVTNRPDAWVDLAGFYARRKQNGQAVDAVEHAASLDHDHDSTMVYAAEKLMQYHLRPDLSEQYLRTYIQGDHQSDLEPVFKAETLLARLLAQQGDRAAARTELNQALSLASNYSPAQKALHSL